MFCRCGAGMDRYYFVSYSRIDGEEFARRLADRLVADPPSHAVWLDVRDMQPGVDWDEQIKWAIQACRGLLFAMTSDSVQDHSTCKAEWVWALKYKKPIIPLRVDASADLPFRLSSRQYIDFSGGLDTGLARLHTYLDSVGSPRWVLQELRNQLAEAERELPRADPVQRSRVEQDIQDLRKRIADQERLVADPDGAARRTQERINAAIDVQRRPERPAAAPARAKFVNEPPVVAPGYFQDRHVESELAGDFLRAADERIMTVIGRGGVGKTAMVCRLLKTLEGCRLPDDLGELDVDGIVYLSPAGAHPVNFPNLVTDLCRLLPQETADPLLQRYRDSQQTPTAMMRALLDAFPPGRVVVLLDQVEDVIDTSTADFAITDAALDEALRALLAAPAHGVKVIVTARVAPRALLLVHPERQRTLPLDEGLGSPHAQEVLRARDPDGRLGLKTAPDELLDQARQRTRGYPRALEALAAILAADRNTTLPELLDQTARLPENVVQVLVGEAFNRLDPLAQQVMQALAIFTVPIPPVAVDYLLQPYRLAVDAAPVLGRLVNMQFVRRDLGRYYLHQVDRDYSLSRVPAGDPADRQAHPEPFTQQALRHRAASYFAQTRTPREDWKTLDDLAPQLNEYELRYQGGDYDTAAQVLLDISSYLIRWGHARLAIQTHERLQGRLDDPWINAASNVILGTCYRDIGQITRGIDLHQQALATFRQTGNRAGEAIVLGNLGLCYYQLGQIAQAIDLYEQALTITRQIGGRVSEGSALGNLGGCYRDVGQYARAINRFEQALTIHRQAGNRVGEGSALGNLGLCYRDLGQLTRAIDLEEQALTASREAGSRRTEANILDNLANAYSDLGAWSQAAEYSRQAIDIADAISVVQVQSEARLSLARIQLLAGDLQAAQQTALAAREHPYPLFRAQVSLIAGITQLRQAQPAAAAQEFRASAAQADELLQQTSGAFAAQDARALALCGLVLSAHADKSEATAAFRSARAITSAEGIVKQVLALFDSLAVADDGSILTGIRQSAEGKG
jgi:tetratricopeptide (TPR) repeat protein